MLRFVRDVVRDHTTTVDIAFGVLVGLVFLIGPILLPAEAWEDAPFDLRLDPTGVVFTVVLAFALIRVRRRPAAVLAAATAIGAASLGGGHILPIAAVALSVAMYTYTFRAPFLRALAVAGLVSVVLAGASLIARPWDLPENVLLWLWTVTAVGVAIAAHRSTVVALEDRARRAEVSREDIARRRVAEERLRIARDLHDVIAHQVAVMSVQAAAASHLMERDPAAATDALGHVREAGRTVLVELQSVLGVLRQDGAVLPTSPSPGLAGLDQLVESFRRFGALIEVDVPERLPLLPESVDLTAFRLVQEALTNVHKHAFGAPTVVTLTALPTGIVVDITNTAGGADVDPDPVIDGAPAEAVPVGSGLGLVGMRERVGAVGGALEVGPTPEGGYRVLAQLPVAQQAVRA